MKPGGRMGHSSVYDEDSGLVYVYGGQIGDRAVDDLLVYDPVTHHWSKRERYVPADKVTPSSLSFSFLVTWSQKLASPLSPPSLSLPLCLCHTRFNSLSVSLQWSICILPAHCQPPVGPTDASVWRLLLLQQSHDIQHRYSLSDPN